MSQCLWSLAISLKKQPGDNVVRIKHYVCLHFNIHFIGRKNMETSLCSLTMECGPSCNALPLSSTRHHRQGSPFISWADWSHAAQSVGKTCSHGQSHSLHVV